jgi:hypothetical protein
MTNKEEIETVIRALQASGNDVKLDPASKGMRLVTMNSLRNIGPRMEPAEMVIFLNGYVNGVEETMRKHREMQAS